MLKTDVRSMLNVLLLIILLRCIYYVHETATVLRDGRKVSFKLDYCNCERTLELDPPAALDETLYNQTTCSRAAFHRGSHQKVIGFSFYGDPGTPTHQKRKYFEGIKENLEKMRKFYPGWIMRLYFDLTSDDVILEDICKLACKDSNLDLCDAGNLPGTPMIDTKKIFPMFWRFFPTLDPQVDLLLSRDLDSRFSDRELTAVNEWLASGQPIHAMRDHPDHKHTLLGGMWDANLMQENIRGKWKETWKTIFEDSVTYSPRNIKQPDQIILDRHVWRWGRNMSIQHDSYNCHLYPGSIGWPTQRLRGQNNFVGAVIELRINLWDICPEKCRRKEHPEWDHC